MISIFSRFVRGLRMDRRRVSASVLAFLWAATAVADVTYEYDEAGRLRRVIHDNGMVTTYVLDAAGNRTSVTTGNGTGPGSIEFVSATYSVGEGGTTAAVTLRRTGGSTGAVGASVSTANGTATAGSDYTAVSGASVSWATGDSANKTVNVTIAQDTAVESNETVNLTVSAPTGGATLGAQTTAVLTITDDDTASAGTLQFSAATYSVGEAGPTATITVARTGGTTGAVGVTYATSNGTATAGSDYTAATSTLSWASGDSASKTFTVAITNDTAVESNETVNLALSAPTGGAALGSQTTAVLTITDNDTAPIGTLQFTAATFSVSEAGPTATITVSRTGGTSGAVGVTYATSNGTATAGSDYTAATSTLSWASGDSANKTFTVAITDDTAVESNETVNLTLSAPTGGATLGSQTTAVLTITNNDNPPAGSLQFTATSYPANEAAGQRQPTITVSRTGGSFGAVTVPYTISAGSATAGSDYTSTNGSLSWADGDTGAKAFVIDVLDDSLVESVETVNLALGTPTGGATLGSPNVAVVNIGSDDSPPVGTIQLTASSFSVSEGGSSVTITASRTGGSSGAVGVTYATSNGSAASASDYTAAGSTLSWADGDTANKSFTVTILEDSVYEGAETFNVTLSAPTGGATLGSPTSGTVTISENDGGPAFSIGSVMPGENAGSVTLTVTKTGNTAFTHGVTYTSANGSATAGADYTGVNSSLSFAPGETSKTFTVTLLDDTVYEQNETFTVTLSSPTNGATVSGGPATVTINDNDSGPTFAIADVTPGENAGSVTLTVTKSGSTALTHGVTYISANGSATAGSDYTAVSSSLSFAPGEASKTFTVTLLDDSVYEQNETFTVGLSVATNGASIADDTAVVTINDNDGGPVFSIAGASPSEASGGIALTITKSGSSALTHSVNYVSSNGSAAAGSDYTAVNSSISFSPGESSKTITVPILDDSVYEGNENFFVTLSGATNGASVSGGSGQATVTIVENEAAPVFTVSSATASVNENVGSVTITVNKSGATVFSHNVSYGTTDNTAVGGADYTSTSGTLTFAPGETSKTFSVPIMNDAAPEGSEHFTAYLWNATGNASIGNPEMQVITINDDDPTSTITISNLQLSSTGFPSASVAYYLQSSGAIGGSASGFWLTPQVGMGDYEVLANGSGTVCEGLNWNTWVPLSSTRGWSTSVNDPNGGGYSEFCAVTIQIRRIGTTTVLGTATIEMTATSQ